MTSSLGLLQLFKDSAIGGSTTSVQLVDTTAISLIPHFALLLSVPAKIDLALVLLAAVAVATLSRRERHADAPYD